MKIFYSPKFEKQFKKLPYEIKLLSLEKENYFRNNPFDFRLNTHKLHGKFAEFWAFRINYEYRILFSLYDKNTAVFYNIGRHDIYD
jgi:mRNA-degrading endonuclease YafQ of YafQ-DinJ toxin-antitoxin module